MILGMNPKMFRRSHPWAAYLWAKRRHWALVLQPLGEAFDARIVDDFAYTAQECYSAEIPSQKFFLVYEMCLEKGDPFLMLSVKPDFSSAFEPVHFLGRIAPCRLEDLQEHAMHVVGHYRSYSFIGCNCQHFATDLALSLGLRCPYVPDDEAVARAASDAALAVGVAGATVAITTATGAGVFSAMAATGSSTVLLSSVPMVLTTVAISAFSFSVLGGAALVGVAGGYRAIYDGLRDMRGDADGSWDSKFEEKNFQVSWPSRQFPQITGTDAAASVEKFEDGGKEAPYCLPLSLGGPRLGHVPKLQRSASHTGVPRTLRQPRSATDRSPTRSRRSRARSLPKLGQPAHI